MGFKVEACKACTLKCRRSHGNKANKAQPPTITISFFKIILGDSSKPLFLPPKFARTLISSVDEDTYLEDSNGERWTVKLSTIDGSLAFQQGWHEFASDHSVNIGEMLIFKYIVGSHFVVQIFGKNGCEKLNFSKRKKCDRRKRSRTGLSADHLNSFKEDRSSNPAEVPCCRNFEGQFGQMLPTKLGSYKPGDNNSGPEDLDEVPMATGKVSHDTGKPQIASATNHNVPFRMADQDSVSNQGGCRDAPINLSDSEKFERESDAIFMDKMPMPTNKSSQNCNTLERTHMEKVSVPIEKAPHNEKSSERPQSASSTDYEAVPSCVLDKDSVSIKGENMTETSPQIGNGSGRFLTVSSIDLSQHTEAALHIINKDDMSKVPMPTKNSHNCNVSENLDKISLPKTPRYENSSKRLQTSSSMDVKVVPSGVVDKDSVSVKGGSRTESSSQIGNGSGRFHTVPSTDHNQHMEATSEMINRKPVISKGVGRTAPRDLSLFEMSERKYGAEDRMKRLRTLKRRSYKEISLRNPTKTSDEKKNLNISGVRECMADSMVLLPKMVHSPYVEKVGRAEESIRKVVADAVARKSVEKANSLLKVDENFFKVVKAEPESLDSVGISSPDAANCSCSVSVNSLSCLVLPENFSSSNKGWRNNRKVILLCDPAMRVWPVFYHENRYTRILASGWEAFAAANDLREGNVCTFEVAANEYEDMFQVGILKE